MTEAIGGNAREQLQSYGERLTNVLNEIADLQEDAKSIRTDAKNAGFDVKALNQCVKELRKGPEYRQGQLELELVLDTYRKAMDLPTEFDAAQNQVREAAAVVPEPRKRGKQRGNGDV